MLDALTLDQLRTFVTVAEAGSFRAGASRLSRVQSGVSHAIANLEAELGIALFDRSGHRPRLTPEGRALLEDARAILLKVDVMRARARGLGEGVEIELSLTVDTLFPIDVVGAALRELRESYPAVGVRMETAALGGPVNALIEGRCMLAVTVAGESLRDPRIDFEWLSSLSFVAVAAAGHPLADRCRAGHALDAAELADEVQIVQADPSTLSAGRDFGVLSPRTWRVSGQDSKHALIRAGVGWGRLPLWAVERDLEEGRLVRIPAASLGEGGAATVDALLARRTDRPFGPVARALRAALLQRVASVQP